MSRPRRRFDREFRDGAVRIVEETGRPVSHVARELGVHEDTLGNWVRRDRAERAGGISVSKKTVEASIARQGIAIHRQRVRQSLLAPWNRTIHWPHRQRVGQRPGRVVLLHSPTELIDRRTWATKAQARQEITLRVHGWYNQHRLHSVIGMVPPVEHELTHTPNPQNQPLHD